MKFIKKQGVANYGLLASVVLTIVMMIVFSIAYNGSRGYFATQYKALTPFIWVCVGIIVSSLLALCLSSLKLEGVAGKAVAICVDVLTVLVCCLFALSIFYMLRCSVYEMGLAWASDLHADEPFVSQCCVLVIVGVVFAVLGILAVGITGMFDNVREEKPVEAK